ncbi:MAG: 6-phosphogluconolactonase [Actinobacteria bacterium]|nr:6-phosphogluconolactonase [Actinomycetota bacterium]
MPFTIHVTNDFDQMSAVAAGIVVADIEEKQASKPEYVLGLATGNSPTGVYKHLAKALNNGDIDAGRIRTFNLDEYVGLPGENAQQRCLHRESYSYFMTTELFALMQRKFAETSVPWGTLVDQDELVGALERQADALELQGADKGKAIIIGAGATGVLREIKDDILDAYDRKIAAAGGIDLHVVGVGGRGHVAFHESGIPFEGNRVLLVQLDDNTVENAVADGHFPTREDSPRYAISMGAELVYEARKVVLLANGARKTGPVAESILGEVTCEVPISYGRRYVAGGGDLEYVLDDAAAAEVLARQDEVAAKGCRIVDHRGEPYSRVADLAFCRDAASGLVG